MKQLLASVLIWLLGATAGAATDWQAAGERMLEDIEQTVAYTRKETGVTELSAPVIQALRRTPRHEFVPADRRAHAYENRPLPIGYGQTISQPYIVALMTELLGVGPRSVVLEVGTGSGYQAAVLAAISAQVYSIEIVEPLGLKAAALLQRLGYHNVAVRVGDGYYGWPAKAPFDAIIVTAAAGHVPPPLVEQLRPGGRLVIPVGTQFAVQQLLLVSKDENGKLSTRQILPVQFVPLTGGH